MDLSDDHAELDPLLAEITAAAARLGTDRAAAGRMAKALTTLADLLDEHIDEHIDEEERLLFPVIAKYVPEADWKSVEDEVRKGGDIGFDLPRIGQYARPEGAGRAAQTVEAGARPPAQAAQPRSPAPPGADLRLRQVTAPLTGRPGPAEPVSERGAHHHRGRSARGRSGSGTRRGPMP
ncbi:hemerythrin domain-containing protein [Nonomuraea jabiensis]|uniref:hemerythrin domain-containing protein n=1 Tax=Nonomuraea jabiensis TaxID=882448 RepID=UPI003680952D